MHRDAEIHSVIHTGKHKILRVERTWKVRKKKKEKALTYLP